MLSLFPTFFDYSVIAVTVLRVVVALIFIAESYNAFPRKGAAANDDQKNLFQKIMILVETVFGILLLIGLFTQVAALVLAFASLKKLRFAQKNKEFSGVLFGILLFFVSLSFLFLGPGIFGVDYPL